MSKLSIPSHLEGLSFVKVLHGSKKPFENGWTEHPISYKEAQEWLKRGGNYGILGGWNDVLTIDLDRKNDGAGEIINEFYSFLPPTFTTKTPSGGEHLHYICSDWDGTCVLEKNGVHIGECRYWGAQTLGPGSIHPDYNKPYTIKANIPLAHEEARIFIGILGQYIIKKQVTPIRKRWDGGKSIDISSLLKTGSYSQNGEKFTGAHPVHGSSTGKNFIINTDRNEWHCFRHGTGGGALSLIAICEGIIDCKCAVPGGLKGELFKKTIKVAKEKYGIEIKKEKFNPNIIADQLMAESEYIYCNQSFYEYECGVYKRLEDIEVDKKTKEFLNETYNKHRAEQTRHCIAVEKHIKNNMLNADRNRINLLNGIFNLEEMKMEEHSKAFMSSIQIPVIYDKTAKCPLWEKTLCEIFMDVQWKISCLQEFMGYCLTADNSHQKALLNIGRGANGKSLIFKIQRTILGNSNVASVTIENLSNRHYLAGLYGKLVNLSIESETKGSVNESDFKAIVTGDPITVDEKYGKPFDFEPFCKLIFSMNELPRIDDKTEAAYRRMLIINYERQFCQEEQNRYLYNQLLPEISGIFNWMICGLVRLNERGYFEEHDDMGELIKEYKKENNPIIEFIEEKLCIDADGRLSKMTVYKEYVSWCRETGHLPLSDKKVTKQIRQYFNNNKNISEKRDGGNRYWEGLKLQAMEWTE